jgi:8-hydroxy-5-deazaflavin:NADPH oxidoreductase
MKLAVIGIGNIGGALADRWEMAGHEVTRIGREGGSVSDAEAVVVAVPGGAIREALDNVQGLEGKTVIDATNLLGVSPPKSFSSNAEFVKSRTNGPTAKSFNANFAVPYDRIGEAGSSPSKLWCGDEEARQVVEQLSRDAGYEAGYAGPLENAAARRTSSVLSSMGSARGGWAHSCIGLRLLTSSESTNE